MRQSDKKRLRSSMNSALMRTLSLGRKNGVIVVVVVVVLVVCVFFVFDFVCFVFIFIFYFCFCFLFVFVFLFFFFFFWSTNLVYRQNTVCSSKRLFIHNILPKKKQRTKVVKVIFEWKAKIQIACYESNNNKFSCLQSVIYTDDIDSLKARKETTANAITKYNE